jgi:hypothetical protein
MELLEGPDDPPARKQARPGAAAPGAPAARPAPASPRTGTYASGTGAPAAAPDPRRRKPSGEQPAAERDPFAPPATASARPAPAGKTQSTTERDVFAPPDQAGEEALELGEANVRRVDVKAAKSLPGIETGSATKKGAASIRDRIHDTPLVRATLGLVLALALAYPTAELYAANVDESKISFLLKEKAEIERDGRPADAPRSLDRVRRELEDTRLRQGIVFALIWLGGALVVGLLWFKFV